MKIKHNLSKYVRYSENNAQREIHGIDHICQKTKIFKANNLSFHLRKLEKERK